MSQTPNTSETQGPAPRSDSPSRPSRAPEPTWHPARWCVAFALAVLPGLLPANSPFASASASAFAAPAPADTHSPAEAALLAEMASQGTNTSRLYRLGDVCHDAGVAGDKKAVERAEAYLRQILTLEPTNAPALALLGSVYTMKGRDAFWPTTQLRLVHEGNDFMDQAVALAPDNPRVRITRAFNNAHMPEFLGRTETVRADLSWLLEQAARTPMLFTLSERQEIALHWGRQLKRQKRLPEARAQWELALTLDPESRLAKELLAELAKLK